MRKITIVAEVSANHGFDLQVIKKTLQAISESGADAVKIQTLSSRDYYSKLRKKRVYRYWRYSLGWFNIA
jgi:sialic acid synthase SpsE